MPLRGLTVSDGQLLRDGVRFRNIGLNYGGAIQRIYSQPSATACAYTPSAEQDAMLDVAEACKAKVLRIKATPYWPAQWRYGVNGGVAGVAATSGDRAAHYAQLDAFIAKCRARGIGVILNLFFRHASVADLAGQTVRTGWLTGGSATRTYAQAVTQEIVTRYLAEDAVYGYEFSNELNHYNDAADAALGTFPGVNTTYGSQASYSAANTAFNGNELSDLLAWWYGVVRAIDNQRIVLTGNGPSSYSQPGGAAGISTPMSAWHREQVRDNPTNCGSIHWYGNVGYSSPNFRGLNPVLTGVRHWQKSNGRGFVLGEFGCQPWSITALSGDGSTLTATVASSCPVEVGDSIQIGGTGSVFDGQTLSLATVNAGRTVLTAPCTAAGSWSGSVKGLQYMSQARVQRMCRDIIDSGTDVALFWMLDGDTGRPIFESVDESANAGIRAAILAANTELGW
jgi:hypothetical protein